MNHNTIHPSFRLNGVAFHTVSALLTHAKSSTTEIHLFLQDWFNDEEFVMVYTSGSTGKPKPIRLYKKYMVNSAMATGSFFDLAAGTTALLCMSTQYIAGKMMVVRALVLGWDLDVVEPSKNPFVKSSKNYDFSAIVPLQLEHSLADLHKVKKLIVGGGAVSPSLREKLQNISTEVFATYGMTETITHIAAKKLNTNSIGQIQENYFRTLPNVLVKQDHRGCLVIEAPMVSEEEIITNDIVRLQNTNCFEWLGRYDNVINSGGVKLHPEIIEEKMASLLEDRFFVFGVPDALLGEKLVLVIEGEETKEKHNAILRKIQDSTLLHKYEKPKNLLFVSNFIETETKKIQRKRTMDLLK